LRGFWGDLFHAHSGENDLSDYFIRALLGGRETLNKFSSELTTTHQVKRLDISPRLRKAGKVTIAGKVDFRGLIFMRLAMTDCDMSEADLRGTGLAGNSFLKCNFSGSELSQVDISNVNFSGCNFKKAFLAYSKAENCRFSGSNMHSATLRSARLNGSDLTACTLTETDLRAANCENTDFSNSNLAGSVLRSAYLKGAILENCNLEGALVTSYYDEIAGKTKLVAVTDLSSAVGLSQGQVDSMIGDANTILPIDLVRPAHWAPDDVRVPSLNHALDQERAPPVGASAQPSILGEKVGLVKKNKVQIDLLCASLVYQIDDELQRLRGWNVASDEEMAQRDRVVQFLQEANFNAVEILRLTTANNDEADVQRASFLYGLTTAFSGWLDKNKAQLIDDSVRFSIISCIALLCGLGGTVIPLVAVAMFGGEKLRELVPKFGSN
jgi:uncharacterized protein YjbI with pentapeptide repeats